MSKPLAWLILPLMLAGSPHVHAQTSASPGAASNDTALPTIPETQIAPAPLSSPFEFVSVATSADDFVIRAGALAQSNSEDPDVKALAEKLAKAHEAMMAASQAAAKEVGVDIAKPGVDGEQFRLLGLMEAARGEEFDKLFLEGQIFVRQRTIAYYLGYESEAGALGAYAKETRPALQGHYADVMAAASARGLQSAQQKPASD